MTILQADGNPRQVIRSDLKSLRSTGQSLMPEGLESGLKPQDLADLIAFVRSAGPQPARKTLEGNRPEVVLPDAQGVLRLTAGNAEIYGSTLVLERQYGNLGMWTSDNDHATWTAQPRGPASTPCGSTTPARTSRRATGTSSRPARPA